MARSLATTQHKVVITTNFDNLELQQQGSGTLSGGVFWCYRDQAGVPEPCVRDFVANQNGYLVATPGFDELMLLLGEALKFDLPDCM